MHDRGQAYGRSATCAQSRQGVSDADQRLAGRRVAVDEGDDHARSHQAMLRCRSGECCGHALEMPKDFGAHVRDSVVTYGVEGWGDPSTLSMRVQVIGPRPEVDRFRMWLTALLESKP